MAVVKNLMVRAGADFSAITKQAKKAQQSASGLENAFSRAGAGIKKALGAVGIGLSVGTIISAAKDAKAAYDAQAESQTRLAQVMRNTMGASNGAIQSILDLTEAQQRLGVISDDVQTAGAQELATYLTLTSSLKTLIPVMNDMAVQQYGYNVTAEQTQSIATMLGKVMEGQVGGLSRYGYYFTAAQEAVLKFGDEAQRAAMLAEVVEGSVGGMNAALAATPTGRFVQLRNTIDSIKASFGQALMTVGSAFLPALNTVATILADVATLANRVAQSIANVFGGKSAAKAWSYAPASVASATFDASDGMDNLGSAAKKAGKAIKDSLSTADFDMLHVLKDPSSSSGGSGGSDGGSYSGGGGGAASGISETGAAADDTVESIGWLEKVLNGAKNVLADFKAGLDFGPLSESATRLKQALEPLAKDVGEGLRSLWDGVLKPLGQWTINEAAPAVLDTLAGIFAVMHSVLDKLKPVAEGFYNSFLKPVGEWAGDTFISALDRVTTLLHDLSDVISGEMSFSDLIADMSTLETVLASIAVSVGTVSLAIKGCSSILETLATLKAIGTIGGLGSKFEGTIAPIRKVCEALGLFKKDTSMAGEMIEALGWDSKSLFGAHLADIALILGGAVLNVTNFVKQLKEGASVANVALGALGLAIAAVGAILLGAPASVAAVVAAAVFAVEQIASLVVHHWDEIKAWAEKTCKAVSGFFSDSWSSIKATAQKVGQSIKSFFTGLPSWFNDKICGSIKKRFSEAWANVQSGAATAKSSLQNTWSSASTWFQSTVTDPIRQRFTEGWAGIQSDAATAKSNLQTKWSDAAAWFQTTVTTPIRTRFAEGWAAVQSGAASAKANLQSAWSSVGAWFQANVSGPIRARFSEAWASAQSSAAAAKANIQSGFSGLSGWINSNFLTPMKSNVRNAINGIIGYFEGMANRAISGVNSIIRALNNVSFSVPSWVPKIGGKSFGINLRTLSGVSLPRLAAGDVIQPHDEFLAVLGDQKSGRNIETPERLLRDIVREESGNDQLISLLRDVIDAIYEAKPVYLDDKRVDRALSRTQTSRLRAAGKA